MSHAILNPKSETIARDALEQLQIERLQSTLNRAYRNVAFYHAAFDSHCVNIERIRNLAALRDLPFVTREDLCRSYPYDMFAVPLRDIVRIHSTPGTGGNPIVVGYTRNDLRNWTECAARLLAAAGITEHDVVQIAFDYNLFPGAFGFHQGAEQIGASVIPTSLTTSVPKQIAIMKDFKTTALISTPGYAGNIAAGLEELQVHPERLNLRLGLFGGEQWSDELRRQLETRLHLLSFDTYGPTEILGPGMAGECQVRSGLHINEDHFIVEIIDPRTLAPVADGQEGELVVTAITREGFPLIRYRTGNVTSLDARPCPCGRTFVRMSRVSRRTDDMIFFRGLAFFPSQVQAIIRDAVSADPRYQIILDREAGLDCLEVRIEVSAAIPSLDEVKTIESLRAQLARRLKEELDIEARVVFAEPRSLPQAADSVSPVIDRRPR
jgi:phenylacetate-CoA ligase